jgi:hypothetical protein
MPKHPDKRVKATTGPANELRNMLIVGFSGILCVATFLMMYFGQ